MTLKQYLQLMSINTILCWFIFILSLFLIDPEKTGLLGFILFYFSLFLAILGTAAIIGFIIRVRLGKKPIFLQVSIAFRQGFELALIVIFFLLLKGLNIFHFWLFLFFILIILIIELLIWSSRKRFKSVE
jgi:hypothetical protein